LLLPLPFLLSSRKGSAVALALVFYAVKDHHPLHPGATKKIKALPSVRYTLPSPLFFWSNK
jgi:hypothetical protein